MQNNEASGAVIAAALTDPTFCAEVLELPADIFPSPAHHRIRQIMGELFDRGERVTRASVLSVAPKAEQALDALPSPGPEQLAILHRSWLRSQLASLGSSLQALSSPDHDPEAALEGIEDRLVDLRSRRVRRAKRIGETARLLAENPPPLTPVLRSGIECLDSLLITTGPTDYVVLGARPSVGKSSLALQIAREVAQTEEGVLLFSLEMDERLVTEKALIQESGATQEIVGRIKGSPKVVETAERLSRLPISICDDPNVTVRDIRAETRRIMGRGPLSLVIVDYIQIIRPLKDRQGREREVAEISRALKVMAKELGVCVLALAQLRRGADHKDVDLDALRESGAIESDADAVIFLSRKKEAASETARATVAKNRRGPTGACELRWNGIRQVFTEANETDEGEILVGGAAHAMN